MTRALALLIAFATLVTETSAQQRTIYGTDGRAVARSTTDSQGTVTTYGADGKVISRETNTRSGTTVYDAKTGNAVGKVTREKR